MPTRTFPFTPKSTAQLKIGDLWAVQLTSGHYGCMQVADLRRTGPGARSTFIAGPLHWRAARSPRVADVDGRRLLEIGLVRFDVFGASGQQVFGNSEPCGADSFDSNYGPHEVGSVTRVYGHLVIPQVVERALSDAV